MKLQISIVSLSTRKAFEYDNGTHYMIYLSNIMYKEGRPKKTLRFSGHVPQALPPPPLNPYGGGYQEKRNQLFLNISLEPVLRLLY